MGREKGKTKERERENEEGLFFFFDSVILQIGFKYDRR